MNIFTFSSSFALGALDGISPGHGKSLMAAFLIGERLQWRQLLAMGLSLLVSHFLLLIALSALLQYTLAGKYDLHWLEWIGPVMVILFGLYLLIRYRKLAKSNTLHQADCSCGHHDHHHHGEKTSGQHPVVQPARNATRQATLFGLVLGLVPCPMALSTILLSMSADQFSSALLVILTYVIGLASVLTAIAVMIFLGRNYMAERVEWLHQRVNVRLISAWMVIGIGVAYLLMNGLSWHVHPA